ncbi:MAG: tRNA (N(6)-L-threonylcarbamoyladenosine(37)-C(2))-methylthiotransferase MtaB [Elusimicrobiota bacterium]
MRFSVKSFGCKVNQIEIQSIYNDLLESGLLYDEKNYDILIINSCCVTEKAEKDLIKFIKKARIQNPDSRIIVTGCMATLFKEKIKNIDYSVEFFTNKNKSEIVKILTGKDGDSLFGIKDFGEKTRAFVKVQDGCNLFCSYCIVPFARNEMISKPFSNVINEIKNLVLKGYKEMVLSGTRLGAYFYDGKKLSDLLLEISKLDGDFRIRLSSLEPMEINEKLIDILSNPRRFCSYFHIPLQSASDSVLKSMKRPYSIRHFLEKLNLIRKKMENVGVYSDVIVGYPQETEEDFKKTIRFVEENKLSGLHVFTYSKRPLTEAYNLEDINLNLKKERSEIMHEIDKKLRKDFITSMIGKDLDSIAIKQKNNYTLALTTNFIEVKLKEKIPKNERFNVRIADFVNGIAYGEI